MIKKTYDKPHMTVVVRKHAMLICTSPLTSVNVKDSVMDDDEDFE